MVTPKTIFQIIEEATGRDEILADDEEVREIIAQDYRENRQWWRVTTTGAEFVRWVRLFGGGGFISHNSHHEVAQDAVMATFLIPRDAFPDFYCDHIMKRQGCKGSLPKIQEYQRAFDAKKDDTVVSVEFTPAYAVVCLVEELGEFARCIKKGMRAEANGLLDKLAEWEALSRDEATDILIYLVKVFNKHNWDMAESYYEKMARNHAELDKGGGKFLGTEETEAKS